MNHASLAIDQKKNDFEFKTEVIFYFILMSNLFQQSLWD